MHHEDAGFYRAPLVTLVNAVPDGDAWLHELKFDGYRIFCRVDNGVVTVLTRNAQNWTDRFGVVVDAAKKLPIRRALIDGEVVALRNDGKHSFQLLQKSLRGGNGLRILYYAFDLLYLRPRSARGAPGGAQKIIETNLVRGKTGDHSVQRALDRSRQGSLPQSV